MAHPFGARFPRRHYTDRQNRIQADRIAEAGLPHAALLARRELRRMRRHSAREAIDAVDAAYERAGIEFPDTVMRDAAVSAHRAGRASFAVGRSGPAHHALGQVYAGTGDLAAVILRMVEETAQPLWRELPFKAAQVLPYLHPVNAAARTMLAEAWTRLEFAADQSRAAA